MRDRPFNFILPLGMIIAVVGCDRLIHGEATSYAPGFSEKGFAKVKSNATMQEVIALLGPPVWQYTQQWSEVWTYSPTPAATPSKAAVYSLFGEHTRLAFDTNGIVLKSSGNYLQGDFEGLAKDEVKRRVGAPAQKELKDFKIMWFYTVPHDSGNGTYKTREVHFDDSYHVVETISGVCYD
jgi:hypothetical protein